MVQNCLEFLEHVAPCERIGIVYVKPNPHLHILLSLLRCHNRTYLLFPPFCAPLLLCPHALVLPFLINPIILNSELMPKHINCFSRFRLRSGRGARPVMPSRNCQ